ncbi:hypothetical protein TELCIR_07238 [Teladorsagia circumcincta]|uniref:Uncharacterized protein n=1 Tax=Teladorsagia circumcincta TaxID=45464 RepID=A0A2G9UKW7_TELCI|nr:hypothetical protein TELCIR_07238 [Teladorsagia circumcincta]
MFARKAKASDLMGSLQRFNDMTRDSVSRVKHLKILLDSLSTQEKRQLIEEHSFETFHLVDELLLSADIVANPQGAVEGESGLWTLEQVLCFAPELVGNGWQRHAIEAILKKALYPRNLLAIRKIAIRLFLIFYQSLSIFGKRVGISCIKQSCEVIEVPKVINLYIAECFPDIETNGVDIFGGWEGAEDAIEALDTADPIVIARSELMYRLCQSATRVCSHSDKYSQEMSSAFAMTVLSNMVLIKAVRQIEVDDKLWDEVHNVFQRGIWIQMAQQWARLSQSVTRAMILHLAHVDIFTQEDLDKANIRLQNEKLASNKKVEASEDENTEENSAENESNGDNTSFLDADDITNAVQTWSGNPAQWLQVWRRFMCVLGPHSVSSANALIAVETLSNTINSLLAVNLDPLAHWIAARLVQTPVNLLPNCIASLGMVLNSSRQPSSILQAHILHAFMRLIKAGDPQVLPHVSSMSPRHLMVLSQNLLQAIPAMISENPPTTHALKVLALLCPSNAAAEQLLLKQWCFEQFRLFVTSAYELKYSGQ